MTFVILGRTYTLGSVASADCRGECSQPVANLLMYFRFDFEAEPAYHGRNSDQTGNVTAGVTRVS